MRGFSLSGASRTTNHPVRSFAMMSPNQTKAAVKHNTAVIDMLAIGIALMLAVLVRFNVVPHISF
jgi:hypothetical protein